MTGRVRLLSVLVENRPGVLNRVASLLRGRGFNIESLSVGPTEDADLSRMTIAVHVGSHVAEQAVKQLYKVVEVVKVSDLTDERVLARQLLLVKVAASRSERARILQISDICRGRIVDVAPDSVVIEVSGEADKLENFLELMRPFGIREVARTGQVAMTRGSMALAAPGHSAEAWEADGEVAS
jgi:acetolactate synthase-1/3 small subunit